MPLPHSDDFESYADSSEAKYFADQIGAFEIHNDTLDPLSNHVMLQMVPEPIDIVAKLGEGDGSALFTVLTQEMQRYNRL